MNDPDIDRKVKHRIQVASQPGSGTVSLVAPTEECLDMLLGEFRSVKILSQELLESGVKFVDFQPAGSSPESQQQHAPEACLPQLQGPILAIAAAAGAGGGERLSLGSYFVEGRFCSVKRNCAAMR
jgi:hypothetical protein